MYLSPGKERILRLFFQDPLLEIHLLEISRRTQLVPDNVQKFTRAFVEAGLLTRRKTGSMAFFKAKLDNPELSKIFESVELKRQQAFLQRHKAIARLLGQLTEQLLEVSQREIQLIALFGSVARGTWKRGSDIDLLTVTPRETRATARWFDVVRRHVEPLLDLAPVNTTIAQFTDGLRKRTAFYDELWRDRIVLYNEFLFWQLTLEALRGHG
ncbi:MAG: nucleotidyltransferase domain-containing protein [Candidatus Omnitrophica bacterium]|nr:nucleotidyltransferase domain-containing protein [Candidatus Omnitrophota bacterium]MBI2495496.1 nucleotidyltransferase domain-containing protein [Candidatus Omnitrophota bacterium]MBI3022058.1 nucleotidyltransferase domain-containing protein [Candidatus Omnitrophota bacterium]MBI3083460.1 nucleotidyltransferase domain-containing protein [Candidatus Omnitrophota bacterium]